jgi:Mg2+-importing ATPase
MSTVGNVEQFWSLAPNYLMAQLGADPGGLTSAEAKRRLLRSGPNRLHTRKRTDVLTLLLAQFKSPLILILLGAVMLSFFLREPVDASIIIAIVLFGLSQS